MSSGFLLVKPTALLRLFYAPVPDNHSVRIDMRVLHVKTQTHISPYLWAERDVMKWKGKNQTHVSNTILPAVDTHTAVEAELLHSSAGCHSRFTQARPRTRFVQEATQAPPARLTGWMVWGGGYGVTTREETNSYGRSSRETWWMVVVVVYVPGGNRGGSHGSPGAYLCSLQPWSTEEPGVVRANLLRLEAAGTKRSGIP